jgi:hypothetical protein
MNKEFVPYELAVKLKQLGFDEPCFARFNNDGDLLIAHTEKYIIDNGVDRSEFFTLAPLFQQVFRWFREKHGLQHDITLTVDDNNQLVGFYIVIHKHDSLWNEEQSIDLEVHTTDRDEAELACLDKLIEIVELNQQKL